MDELEFRKRVYANPTEPDEELLAAARNNPALQSILDATQRLESNLAAVANGIEVPSGLAEKLRAIPVTAHAADTGRDASKPASNSLFQYYAIAASVILALGIGIVTLGGGPSPGELAFGSEVIQHLYHEINEIDGIREGSEQSRLTTPAVITAMAAADTHFNDEEFLEQMPVRFAKPCVVLPAYHSAHLMVQGSRGAVNVILINNSPVASEYTIRDDRFDGVVVPMGEGNLILIGEKDENLDDFKSLFSENVEWVI